MTCYKFVLLTDQIFELVVEKSDSVIDVEEKFEKAYFGSSDRQDRRTSSHIWVQQGKILNKSNRRFKNFMKMANQECAIACVYTDLATPEMRELVLDNMKRTHSESDFDDCSICLTPLFSECVMMVTLPSCNHCFHVECLADIEDELCPLCGKKFNLELIKRVSRVDKY